MTMQALVGNIRYRGRQSGVSEAEIETIIRRAQRRNGLNPKPGLYHADSDSDEWEEDDEWEGDEDEEDDWGDEGGGGGGGGGGGAAAAAAKKADDDDWEDDEEDWTDEL